MPTLGFCVETLKYNNITYTSWDLGGGSANMLKLFWRHYYSNVQGIIYVIDSTDKDRIELAKEELWKLLSED